MDNDLANERRRAEGAPKVDEGVPDAGKATLKALCEKGLIERRYDAQGGLVTRPDEMGRPQTVWFVTPLGETVLRERDKLPEG